MEENQMRLHPNLQVVRSMLGGIAAMLGGRYEVILHDLGHPESSVVAVEGSVTDREIGAPITNYVLQILKKHGNEAPDCINYKSVAKDGRALRSSTIFVRDDAGQIIGCMCVNQDLTDYCSGMRLLQDLIRIDDGVRPEGGQESELFAHDISEVMEAMVQSELESAGKSIPLMQKEDKLAVVVRLEEKGIFDVKGSVDFVANRLGVSTFTIYNYIKEVRFSRK